MSIEEHANDYLIDVEENLPFLLDPEWASPPQLWISDFFIILLFIYILKLFAFKFPKLHRIVPRAYIKHKFSLEFKGEGRGMNMKKNPRDIEFESGKIY